MARHPEVERLVLLAPAFGFGRYWPVRLGPAAVQSWRKTGWMDVFHYGENQERSLAYGILEDAAQYEDFPDVSQPVPIFHGKLDDVVPVMLSEQFAENHENAQLEIVNSGHDLLKVREKIAPQIEKFLLSGA
jgi:hypothetical protein